MRLSSTILAVVSSPPSQPAAVVWVGRPSGEAFADMLRVRAGAAGIAVEVEVQAWSLPGGYGVSADWGDAPDAGFFCEVADWVDGVRIFDAGDDDVSVQEALDYFDLRIKGVPVSDAMEGTGIRTKSWLRRWRERRAEQR